MNKDSRLKRYAHILSPAPKYPVWSVRTVTAMASVVAGLVAVLVGVLGHADFLRELEWTVAICAAGLFVLLATGLYMGARVKRKGLPDGQWTVTDAPEDYVSPEVMADVPLVETESVMGCLLSILLWIAVTFLAGFLIWALVQTGGFVIVALIFAMCWVVYRALRMVFARSRECRGKLAKSLGYGAYYTVLYSAWVFGLLHLARYLKG